jgi:hypothetical protein
MTMPALAAQFPPCRDPDPTTERNKSDTGSRIDPVAEARGEGDTRSPDHQPEDESGDDMAGSSLQGGPRRFSFRSAALPGEKGDRHPMVGHDGMEHADDGNGEDKQETGSIVHGITLANGKCPRMSGTAERPRLKKLLAALAPGAVVITPAVDRLSRDDAASQMRGHRSP